jgi:YVTN family beta-propeller protein
MRRAAVTWGFSLVVAVALTACGPGPASQSRARRSGSAPQGAVIATVPLRDWGTDVTAGPDGRAYVVMRTGRVAIVDATTAKVTAEVDVDGEPYAAAVTPRGKRVYVVDYLGQYISVIDTATATVKTRIPNSTRHRPSLRPSAAVSRDARFVYVADTARDHLVVVRTDDDSVVKDLFLDIHPAAVATRADGRYLYVAGCRLACTDGTLLEIDTSTYAITRRLKLAWVPSGLVVTPDGRRAYVSNGTEGTVSSIDVASERVYTIPVGPEPVGIAMDDAGTLVYVTSFQAGTLYAIATAGDQMVASAAIGKTPRAIAVSPDGRRAFVTSSAALVSIVDLAKLRR